MAVCSWPSLGVSLSSHVFQHRNGLLQLQGNTNGWKDVMGTRAVDVGILTTCGDGQQRRSDTSTEDRLALCQYGYVGPTLSADHKVRSTIFKERLHANGTAVGQTPKHPCTLLLPVTRLAVERKQAESTAAPPEFHYARALAHVCSRHRLNHLGGLR